jgi:enoyl-CoA hydratase/carnithine racemase
VNWLRLTHGPLLERHFIDVGTLFPFSMLKGAIEVATDIAAKSPVAVQVTKRSILYSRDHSVQEGLDHIVST